MAAKIKPIPEGYHSVTPTLALKNSSEAIDFYKKAFGAKEIEVFPSPDGHGIMHATIQIGDSLLMLGDENPEMGCRSVQSIGASPVSFYIYVPNVDATFKQAVAAGASVVRQVEDMFWGDRCSSLKDPFGYSWTIATHTRELSKEEILEGAQALYEKAGKQ